MSLDILFKLISNGDQPFVSGEDSLHALSVALAASIHIRAAGDARSGDGYGRNQYGQSFPLRVLKKQQ